MAALEEHLALFLSLKLEVVAMEEHLDGYNVAALGAHLAGFLSL